MPVRMAAIMADSYWGLTEKKQNSVKQLSFNKKNKLKKILQTINAGEGVEKREPSNTVGGNAN